MSMKEQASVCGGLAGSAFQAAFRFQKDADFDS